MKIKLSTGEHCWKRGYKRRRDAKAAMRRLQSTPGGLGVRSVYKCPYCELYHLTSQTKGERDQ